MGLNRSILGTTTRRHTGSPTIFFGKAIHLGKTYGPFLVGVYAFSLFYRATGDSWLGAIGCTLIFIGLAFLVYWRWRVYRAAVNISAGEALLGLFHAWFLMKNWPKACDSAYLSRRRTLAVPPLRRIRVADDGTISCRTHHGRYGVTTESLVEEAGKLAEFLGCYQIAVMDRRGSASGGNRVTRWLAQFGARSGVSDLRFYYEDLVGRLMRLSELPTSPSGTLAYGRRRDGSAAYIKAHLSCLISGMTGFGKSNIVWTMLADAIRKDIPIRLYVSDPKMGIELALLGAQMGLGHERFQVREYSKTSSETEEMIRRVEGAMNKRMAEMGTRGLKAHTPSVAEPLVIVILDESLKLKDMLRKGDDSPLGRIVYTGRVAGYAVWALAQMSQKEILGSLRDLIPQRICLATGNRSMTDAALGDGATASGAECHLIDKAGMGYSFVEGDRRPGLFRAPLVSQREQELIAKGICPNIGGDEIKNDPHYLYRYWGVLPIDRYPEFEGEEVLLYIGISNNWARRDEQHVEEKYWRQFVTRYDPNETWPNRERAEAAEKAAIENEKPIFNQQHNYDNPLRRVDPGIPGKPAGSTWRRRVVRRAKVRS